VLASCLTGLKTKKKYFRCDREHLEWDAHRWPLIQSELLRYKPDVISLCEVDDFKTVRSFLSRFGYEGVFAKKRAPALDGVAIFWLKDRIAPVGVETAIYFEYRQKREPCAQVALLQELDVKCAKDDNNPQSVERMLFCATHLKADVFKVGPPTNSRSSLEAESHWNFYDLEQTRMEQLTTLATAFAARDVAFSKKQCSGGGATGDSKRKKRLPLVLCGDLNSTGLDSSAATKNDLFLNETGGKSSPSQQMDTPRVVKYLEALGLRRVPGYDWTHFGGFADQKKRAIPRVMDYVFFIRRCLVHWFVVTVR
jgi:mRNA deadenylase 3'-5' endonuclease subunit Ccr4